MSSENKEKRAVKMSRRDFLKVSSLVTLGLGLTLADRKEVFARAESISLAVGPEYHIYPDRTVVSYDVAQSTKTNESLVLLADQFRWYSEKRLLYRRLDSDGKVVEGSDGEIVPPSSWEVVFDKPSVVCLSEDDEYMAIVAGGKGNGEYELGMQKIDLQGDLNGEVVPLIPGVKIKNLETLGVSYDSKNDSALVVWKGEDVPSSVEGVVIDSSGNLVGAMPEIPSVEAYHGGRFALKYNPETGHHVMVWYEKETEGYGEALVKDVRINPDGSFAFEPRVIDDKNIQTSVAISVDGTGRDVIVLQSSRGVPWSGSDFKTGIISSDGSVEWNVIESGNRSRLHQNLTYNPSLDRMLLSWVQSFEGYNYSSVLSCGILDENLDLKSVIYDVAPFDFIENNNGSRYKPRSVSAGADGFVVMDLYTGFENPGNELRDCGTIDARLIGVKELEPKAFLPITFKY